MTHELKLQKEYADAVLSGDKSFEIRFNDRGYQKGDLISRSALKDALRSYDKFGYTANRELIRLDDSNIDKFVPYVKFNDVCNCIDNTPTVEFPEQITIKCDTEEDKQKLLSALRNARLTICEEAENDRS